ncbi:MAG: hypothetical protein WBV25_02205 [Methylocella sp.]
MTLGIGSISLDETQSIQKRNLAAGGLPTGRELSLTTQLTA